MNARESLKSVSHDDVDFIQLVLNLFHETGTTYCVIGGLAVNAYAEPVVSLDLYIVVVSRELDSICAHMRERGLRVETYEHSIKLASAKSDLRIQLQTDERYQTFIPRSTMKPVLGYAMWVAAAEDVLQGKIWAYQDLTRRPSERQKDLADSLRLTEAYPDLQQRLAPETRKCAE